MKKKTTKKASKPKATVKKSAAKPKPAKKAVAPKAAPATRPAVTSPARGSGSYTPQAIQGIGWAPFRYGG